MEEKEPKPHLSFSQINMLLRCPRQYEERYVNGIKIPPAAHLGQSKAWHQTMEYNWRQKLTSFKDVPSSEILECYAAMFETCFLADEYVFDEGQDIGAVKDEGILITDVHHKTIAPHVQPAVVEKEFRISLGAEFPYDFVGIWDLIDDKQVIIDEKARSKTPSQHEVDRDLQLSAYSLAYRVQNQSIEDSLRMDVVVKLKKPKTAQIWTKRSHGETIWFLDLLERAARQIQSGIFVPNPNGWHCSPKWCGYWNICKGGTR